MDLTLAFILRYINYKMLARHKKGFGIHSPFIFALVSEIFRNKIDNDIVLSIEKIRRKMESDPGSINVRDLGSGSEKLKTSLRKVSEIVKKSAVPKKYGILLANMASAFGKPAVIEFGTSLGISTMYMAASCSGCNVYTMEGCAATSAVASANIREAGLGNIVMMNGSFDELLPGFKKMDLTPGLVYIDGNHRREPLLRYFDFVADMSGNRTVAIIDDINLSAEMSEAWREIKNHENVTATVDIFRMGIVFFRKDLPRINYVIRY